MPLLRIGKREIAVLKAIMKRGTTYSNEVANETKIASTERTRRAFNALEKEGLIELSEEHVEGQPKYYELTEKGYEEL